MLVKGEFFSWLRHFVATCKAQINSLSVSCEYLKGSSLERLHKVEKCFVDRKGLAYSLIGKTKSKADPIGKEDFDHKITLRSFRAL